MRLYLLAAAALALAEFIPSNEWQEIEEDTNIPGGLDVQLDMSSGKRYARLPQPQGEQENDMEPKTVAAQAPAVVAEVSPSTEDIHGYLNAFEDLAHDLDRGQEIMRNHFSALNNLAESQDPKADQAAKIIQTALRQNEAAINTVLNLKPSYPKQLVGDLSKLTWRKLGIFGSLASTPAGASVCAPYLQNIQEHLDDFTWNEKVSKRMGSILVDLKHMEVPLDSWVSALQDTVAKNGNSKGNQLFQLKALKELMDIEEFEPSGDFMQWLSSLSTQKPTRDNTDWDLIEYAKSVRHSVFGNPFADRVKADL